MMAIHERMLYQERFTVLRAALFPRWKSYTSWTLLCGDGLGWRWKGIVLGSCDPVLHVIWVSPSRRGSELDKIIVHEMVHAVGIRGHGRRFISRLYRACEAAHDHKLHALSRTLLNYVALHELQLGAPRVSLSERRRIEKERLDHLDACYAASQGGSVSSGRVPR